MTIRKKYGGASEAAFASYDWQDIADGTGVIVFQGFAARTGSSTVERRLSRNVTFSSNQTYYTETGSVSSTFLDVDFDLGVFNQPRIVQGEALVAFVGYVVHTGGSGGTSHFNVTLYHVDKNGNETSVGTVQLDDLSAGTGNVVGGWRIAAISLTRKLFKIGEKIRLNITATQTGGTGTPRGAVIHDPSGSTITVTEMTKTFTPGTDYGTTKLELNVPFKIDI